MFILLRRPSAAFLSKHNCVLIASSIFSSTLFAANESPKPLDTMVITSSLTPMLSAKVGSAVTVITAADIKKQQVTYVADILRTVPGLAVNQTGGSFGTLTQVRMRGAEGNQTLVRLDGIELNDPAGGSEYNFGNMLVNNIERIEIIRGAQSALYGSDAVGGVINIITKKGSKGIQLNANAEGGSFGTYKVGGGINGGWQDKVDFSLSVNQFASDGISIAQSGTERDGSSNLTFDGNVSARPLDILELGVSSRVVRADADTDGFKGGIGAVDANNRSETRQNYTKAYIKLNLLKNTDWLQWDHQASFYYSDSKRKSFRGKAAPSHFNGKKIKYAYQTNLLMDTSRFAQSHHALTFLYEHEEDRADTSYSSKNQHKLTVNSYIVEYQLELFKRLSLTGSVRHDGSDNQFKDATTFRTTAAYFHTETNTKLHASYGTGSKNPSLSELYVDGDFSGQHYQGNPDLKAEKSNSWDIGVQQFLFDDRVSLDVTYYNNRIKNFINRTSGTNTDGSHYFSYGNAAGVNQIEGMEVSFTANITEGLDFNSSYTWTSTKDANNIALVRRPKHIASANFNYGFTLFDNRANINLGVKYNGEQTDYAFDKNFSRSTVVLNDYTVVNLAASYEIFDRVELFARVENMFNSNYQEVYSYASRGVAGYGGIRVALGPFLK
jgi:vitamin B12 transporter